MSDLAERLSELYPSQHTKKDAETVMQAAIHIRAAEARIKELEAELAAYRWIHVGERIPDIGRAVVALDKEGDSDHFVVEEADHREFREYYIAWQYVNLPSTEGEQ